MAVQSVPGVPYSSSVQLPTGSFLKTAEQNSCQGTVKLSVTLSHGAKHRISLCWVLPVTQ